MKRSAMTGCATDHQPENPVIALRFIPAVIFI